MKNFITIISFILLLSSASIALADDCKKAKDLVTEGNKYLSHNPEKAESFYSEAVKMCPKSSNVHYNLGISFLNQKKYSDAISAFDKALKIQDNFPEAMIGKAFALVDGNIDTEKGEKLARETLSLRPNDSKLIKLVAMLSVDIDTPLVTKTRNPNAIAVIIGNRDYRRAKSVDYAINDAQTVREYLTKVLGYKEGNVFHIENALKSDFELYFGIKANYKGKLYNNVKEGKSDVFVYYSGHGAPGLKDKKGYFVPVEADPQYIELSGYSLDVFYENLSKVPAKSITVVMDSCFSGANIFDNISPMFVEIDNPVIKLKNGIVISSSQGRQVSSWYNEKKHGMFTYFFLKAIHNKNADYDKDDNLTFDEIYNYISDKTEGVPYYARRIHGVEQTPTIEGKYQDKVFVKY